MTRQKYKPRHKKETKSFVSSSTRNVVVSTAVVSASLFSLPVNASESAQASSASAVSGLPSSLSESTKDLSQTSSEEIPYSTRVVEEPDLPAGVETVVQEGKNGIKATWTGTDKSRAKGGQLSSVRVRNDGILSLPVERVVRRGTKTEVINGVADKVAQSEAEILAQKERDKAAEAERQKNEQKSTDVDTATNKPESSNNNQNSDKSSPVASVTGEKTDWMKAAGIPESDWQYVDYIIEHESGWNYRAVNASSGATGVCQALPGSRMATAGSDYLDNPVTQLKWCHSYANERYGGWQQAYNAWRSQNWW
jgi:phage tail tape measure protein, TP901 family